MPFSNFGKHDWLLHLAVCSLFGASLLVMASASEFLFLKQLGWIAAGILVLFLCSRIDWRPVMSYRWAVFSVYLAAVLLLLLTLFFAPSIRGTRSWLALGSFRFQTSEFAKLALLVVFAYFFARRWSGMGRLRNIFHSFLYFAIPFALVLFQPDWGSASVFFGLWIGFLLLSGIRFRHFAIGIIALVILVAVAWGFVLADYQKERIRGFMKPEYDPLGVNYSVIQAKIAIGSAGWFGKGFGQGTQLQLGFLTEPTTDFVFSAFMEEWGLLGGIFVLAAFALLVFRVIVIGLRADNNFSRFICFGGALIFLIHFFLNVGSNVGFVPIVGIPFPFLSYGGSSLLTKAVLVGIIQSIAVRSSPS